ncbi:DEAD/DEAH box helicase [Paucibacter sp. B2R-40]|uniref:DEAD/DEAH box helicase n=1 Tax=Paucibacter sp. B2R-40 TaxID=2893554 RepID=UPI0021E3EAC5|nr:DEAD/DEAH box helicase [Paucibacter sp. B2R-40]MCV2356563.1 DEAD/DEAH box helicase [Paucibacter sp. B2R-40]
MQTPAPGSRVVIRDEEWLVRRVDPSSDGGHLLTCDGISELVRNQSALFLTELEGPIEVLDPATTVLVADTSPQYSAALLAIESQRRRSVANDASIQLGHRGAMNLVPYQLDPALQALKQPRARILIADSVGLGKTLEAGILATELMQRGRGKRILVVTQKSMLTQFQKEWWCRFSIPLVRLDSVGLARVRNRIPANHNPFNHFDRSIISIDTLKSNLEYRNYLENAWWDIIVIDECHNVAARAGEQGVSRRARLARLLATRSDTMILLSATPHDGSARSFASLMSLLDPTAISDPDDYTPEDFRHKGLVVRRFKKDIRDQVSAEFQERSTHCLRQAATPAEEAAYRALLDVRFTQSGKHNAGKAQQLQRVGMQKGLFSSPAAAAESTDKRIALLRAKPDVTPDERVEIEGLTELALALRAITPGTFSKYQRFLAELRSPGFAWQPDAAADRLVVFSERIETLRWLHAQLTVDLKLKPKQIEVLHGQMTDKEQQDLVEAFGRLDNPLRILLCSDVASEGLNLHYFCHRLVHFDLPWSLMVFQQRNGRVDRYGQKKPPQIVYLFTESAVEGIRGDLRILEILQNKDDQAYKNLGDPSAFLNVYDPGKEADKVAGFMVDGMAPEQVEAKLDATLAAADENEGDWLMDLFGANHGAAADLSLDVIDGSAPAADSADHIAEPSAKYLREPASSLEAIAPGHSLFASDYQWAKTALTLLSAQQQLEGNGVFASWQGNDAESTIAITAPLDLKDRLRQLPSEAQAKADHYTLCASPARMMEAMETARQARAEDDTWPTLHYLWPQHPIMEWLADRVLTTFGRHRAPVLQVAQLPPGTQAFVLMSLVPNRKGQPLLVEWQVACRPDAGAAFSLESFDGFALRTGLRAASLPNRSSSQAPPLAELQAGLPQAVAAMSAFMQAKQAVFATGLAQRLEGTLADLERLQGRQINQLELKLENQLETVKRGRFERRTQQIHRVFDDYRQWVQDTLTTEPQAWIQVVAALCHPAAATAESTSTEGFASVKG